MNRKHLQIVIDQVAALSFLNKFSETSADVREKIMIQTELEEAGFDSATVNKVSVGCTDIYRDMGYTKVSLGYTVCFIDMLLPHLGPQACPQRGPRGRGRPLDDELRRRQRARQEATRGRKGQQKIERGAGQGQKGPFEGQVRYLPTLTLNIVYKGHRETTPIAVTYF